ILFATNRTDVTTTAPPRFSSARGAKPEGIGFGYAIARIPRDEVLNRASRLGQGLGQLDRASGRQTSIRDLVLHTVACDAQGGAGLAAMARERLTRAPHFPDQAFIFVHGYNTSFNSAVKRTAMIAFDLGFDGAAFLFAWPSLNKRSRYRSDRARARAAVP